MSAIKPEVIDIVASKYNILEIIDLIHYDSDFSKLAIALSPYKDHVFSANDRIIFLHHDTDYYTSTDSNGFTMYNLFVLLNSLNLPQEFLILFTNHYGLDLEIAKMSHQICNAPPLKVVYTSLWYDFPDVILEQPKEGAIDTLYCCLNGVNRAHRLLTLCYLKKYDLLSKGMVSYHFSL